MKNFQSFNDDKVRVQTVDFGSLTMRREDFVMMLHMITFPTSSGIGVDDDDYCDTRKMRVMISELIIDKTGSKRRYRVWWSSGWPWNDNRYDPFCHRVHCRSSRWCYRANKSNFVTNKIIDRGCKCSGVNRDSAYPSSCTGTAPRTAQDKRRNFNSKKGTMETKAMTCVVTQHEKMNLTGKKTTWITCFDVLALVTTNV